MSDYRTTTGEPHPLSRRDRRRQQRVWLRQGGWIVVVIVVIGFIIPVQVRIGASGYVTTDVYAEIRPPVAGRVVRIAARSGSRVEEGDLLVQLDDRTEQAALDEALHAVRRAQANLVRREAELAQQARERQHRITHTALRLRHAEAALSTTETLYNQGLASGRALEDDRLTLALTQAESDNLNATDPTLDEKEIEVLRRELDMLSSAADRARTQLDTRRITAPFDGELVRYPFSEGELVTPDMVLYEAFGGERLILKLRIPERHAVRVHPGYAFEARLRTHTGWGNNRFSGMVEHLRPVIQSDTRESYRQAICAIDIGDHVVPPGATAEAHIAIARTSFWLWLFRIR